MSALFSAVKSEYAAATARVALARLRVILAATCAATADLGRPPTRSALVGYLLGRGLRTDLSVTIGHPLYGILASGSSVGLPGEVLRAEREGYLEGLRQGRFRNRLVLTKSGRSLVESTPGLENSAKPS